MLTSKQFHQEIVGAIRRRGYIFFTLLMVVLVSVLPNISQAGVEAGSGEYHQEVEDLKIKVQGGYVKFKRTFYNGKWEFNRDWGPIKFKPIAYPIMSDLGFRNWKLELNGLKYERKSDGRTFVAENGATIVASFETDPVVENPDCLGLSIDYSFCGWARYLYPDPIGYKWFDRKGNWAEYDEQKRLLRYYNRSNVQVSMEYDSAYPNKLTGVVDHDGNKVLWIEYDDPDNPTRITAVRDHADTLQGWRVEYSYTGDNLTNVTDVRGNMWSYGYDETGRLLTSITDPDSRITTFAYDKHRRIIREKNSDGTGTAYQYDYDKTKKRYYTRRTFSSGRIVETWTGRSGKLYRRDVNGVTVETIGYEGNERQIHTNELGHITVREYDQFKNLVKVVYPDSSTLTNEYAYGDELTSLVKSIDERGIVTKYDYYPSGMLESITEALGAPEERTTVYTYDAFGNVETKKRLGDSNTQEAITTFSYDSKGNIKTKTVRVDDSKSITVNYDVYDNMGNLMEWRDGRGKVWKQTFTGDGLLLTDESPLGNIRRYQYNGPGDVTHVYDPDNKLTEYRYDSVGRLEQIVDPLASEWVQEYNKRGMVSVVRDPEGSVARYSYDGYGRVNATADGVGNSIIIDYGAGERGASVEDISSVQFPTYLETYSYDNRGRQTEIIKHVAGTVEHKTLKKYDHAGNIIERIDPEGNAVSYEYDALGRVVTVGNSDGSVIQYIYDSRDNIIAIKNELDVVIRRFEYDQKNRVTKEIWPNGSTFLYEYDGNDNLIKKVDGKGQVSKYTYDEDSRISVIELYAGLEEVTPEKTTSFEYNKLGNIIGYDDGVTSSVIAYDDSQRKLSETINYGTLPDGITPLSFSHAYTYYKNGRVKSFTGPDGTIYTYGYDAANRLSSVSLPGTGLITISSYHWYAPEQINRPGGTVESRTYDPLMRLTGITVKDPADNTLLNYGFSQYDKAGNLLNKSTEHGDYSYSYDDLYRITSVANPALADEAYTYDQAGNRKTAANTSGEWVYNNNNQLQSYTGTRFSYDGNGSVITKSQNEQITTYIYDLENRLSEVKNHSNTTIAEYYYDPLGRRLWKEARGQRIYFIYSDEGLVAEADSSGVITQSYGWMPENIWGTDPLYTKTASGYAYYLNDHLGTPQKLISSNGAIQWSVRYKAFGEAQIQKADVDNNLRFPGQYYDQETGLHYNYFRDYDPGTGRYVQSDPIGLNGGINTYAYAKSNPVMNIDPTGEVSFAVPIAIGLGVGGMVLLYKHCMETCMEQNGEECDSRDWNLNIAKCNSYCSTLAGLITFFVDPAGSSASEIGKAVGGAVSK